MSEQFKKVNFAEYEGKYDESVKEKMLTNPEDIDIETMRTFLYGYTFTKEYADMEIIDELCMDYWKERAEESYLSAPFNDLDEQDCENLDEMDFDNLDESEYKYDDVTPQEMLILKAIDSTGDGKTPETALCVIDVDQEYEYIDRVIEYKFLKKTGQKLCNGIDCIKLSDKVLGETIEIYFDIKRRFDVGYWRSETAKEDV